MEHIVPRKVADEIEARYHVLVDSLDDDAAARLNEALAECARSAWAESIDLTMKRMIEGEPGSEPPVGLLSVAEPGGDVD